MAITEVVFDPRIDLPNGSLGIQPVTVQATPTRIRETGPSTVYPQTVKFTNVTTTTPLKLQSTDGTWAWSLGVYLGRRLLDVRTVFVVGTTVAWAELSDVNPDIFETPAVPTTAALIATLQAQIAALATATAAGYVTYDGTNLLIAGTIIPITGGGGGGAAEIGYDTDGVPYLINAPGFSIVDNGDGTFTLSGPGATDNGDGSYTITGAAVTDNGDGTFAIAA